MTPKQADKLIKSGKEVTLHNNHFHETFTAVIARRDRWNIYTKCGMVIDRSDLEIKEIHEE